MFFCVFPNAKRWFRVRDHKKLKLQKFSIRGRRNVSPPRMRCHRHILIPVHARGPHTEIAPKRFALAGEHGSGSVPGGVPRPPHTRVSIHAVRPGTGGRDVTPLRNRHAPPGKSEHTQALPAAVTADHPAGRAYHRLADSAPGQYFARINSFKPHDNRKSRSGFIIFLSDISRSFRS